MNSLEDAFGWLYGITHFISRRKAINVHIGVEVDILKYNKEPCFCLHLVKHYKDNSVTIEVF